MKEIETWARELKAGKAEEEIGVGEKTGLYPFIKARNIERLLMGLKARIFPRDRANDTIGLLKPVLIRIPRIKDTISALTRHVNNGHTSMREAGGPKNDLK